VKNSIKSIIVLSAICIVVASLLAAVNHITAPIIERAALLAEQESLRKVLEGAEEFEELSLPEGAPETVTGVYREINGVGYAVTIVTQSNYSQAPMSFTVGFTPKLTIADIEITNYSETKNFENYPDSFIGKDNTLSGIDLYSGVTYSSQAFKDAVADAFAALEEVAEQ